jgi:hypothetical protein
MMKFLSGAATPDVMLVATPFAFAVSRNSEDAGNGMRPLAALNPLRRVLKPPASAAWL